MKMKKFIFITSALLISACGGGSGGSGNPGGEIIVPESMDLLTTSLSKIIP